MGSIKPSAAPPPTKGGLTPFSSTTERCGAEIGEWVQHVVRQVEIAGRELKEKAEVLHKKLEVTGEGVVAIKTKLNIHSGDKIKFIPNIVFDELKTADLGFLSIDNVLPYDFRLDLVTLLADLQVGNSVTCVVSCGKVVSSTIFSFLEFSVTHDNSKPVAIKPDSSLKFSYPLASPGEYHVAAQLYGHHVQGSPFIVPVAVSALPGLAQLGLAPLGAGDGGMIVGKSIDSKSEVSAFTLGSVCVAQWSEDSVWYRARVDRVEGEMVEVTFLDYGNKETIVREKLVKCRNKIPAGEDIDEFVTVEEEKFAREIIKETINLIKETINLELINERGCDTGNVFIAGDVVVAKWSEDNTWYNAKVESVSEEGYIVLFTDYGNTAIAKHGKVVKSTADILPTDTFDEYVEVVVTLAPSWSEGSVCIARWSEDSVWYNAVVDSVGDSPGQYQVTFTDYGNTAIVTEDLMVAAAQDIPAEQTDMVDECVKITTTDGGVHDIMMQTKVESELSSDLVNTEIVVKLKSTSVWKAGDLCIACWGEDDVWYNAVVEREEDTGDYFVTFTDYGIQETVTGDRIVRSADDIPADHIDMVDENVVQTSSDVASGGIIEKPDLVSVNPEVKLTTSVCPWVVGSHAIARWAEDDVWYNAVVDSIEESTGEIQVSFFDYGNIATVLRDAIVTSIEEIPADQLDMIDECVQQRVKVESTLPDESTADCKKVVDGSYLAVGDAVIARWPDDLVWYNAVVDCIDNATGEAHVTFVDYGNSAVVGLKSIVITSDEIPANEQEMVDECVQQGDVPTPTAAPLTSIKEEEEVICSPDIPSQESPPSAKLSWTKGDVCIARWAEDAVWYNAEVLENSGEGCVVSFIDYGNEASVRHGHMVLRVEDILTDDDIDECVGVEATESALASAVPPSLQCSLCGDLCRRAMRVACGPAITCWGCAVKEINSSRTCWQCGEREISTETHLVQDAVLRAFVEQFVKTGKLDPVHVKALKNRVLEPLCPEMVPGEVLRHVDGGRDTQHVVKTEISAHPDKKFKVGDKCIARWSEDDIWYNAVVEDVFGDGFVHVNFVDYGNSDQVKTAFVLTTPADLPVGAEVDPHVDNKPVASVTRSLPVEFLTKATLGADGIHALEAKHMMIIKDLKGPVGLTVLGDKTIAVVCKGDNKVKRYSREGQFLGLVSGLRDFVKPADILTLNTGDFVVRDELGIQLFGEQGNFIKNLGVGFINRCYGLAQDELGRVITINSNTGVGGCGKLTELGETDVFYIDISTGAVVKRVELIDIVGNERSKSACRFLSYANKRLYIVDMGLDCVYVLFLKDGEEQADSFGSSGSDFGHLKDPAGLVVDSAGTMMVVDSKNNRLLLVRKDSTFCGIVKVDSPLARPSGIFLDQEQRKLFVSNYADQSVVCYEI